MTYVELRNKLADTCLFSDDELASVIMTCGRATIGNAIVACQTVGITLTGHDIDVIMNTFYGGD